MSCEQRDPRLNPIVGQARAFISAINSKYLNRGTRCLNSLLVKVFWIEFHHNRSGYHLQSIELKLFYFAI
ncbi:MAG: hypothetical protein ACJAZP_003822 [Psychromonas sp.]|jgi:hypothetical protein